MVIALYKIGKGGHHISAKWLCQCDCGNQYIASANDLLHGKSTSCGCKRAISNTKHGDGKHSKRSRLYHIWADMKNRCSSPTCRAYKNYGGRGITVCEEWQQYKPFRDWAYANGYSGKLTLDRIDVNGDYEPDNCRWATWKQQANNKRRTHKLTFNGKTQSITEWSEELGISRTTINNRIRRGWCVEDILGKPVISKNKNHMYDQKQLEIFGGRGLSSSAIFFFRRKQ